MNALRLYAENIAMRRAMQEAIASMERGASPAIAESTLRLALTEIDGAEAARRKRASDRDTDILKGVTP